MNRFLLTMTVAGISLASGLFSTSLKASTWDKKTNVTIDQPLAVQGTVLTPGTYVFKLMDLSSDRNVVMIYNRDESELITTAIATAAQRIGVSGPQFWLYEAAKGSPKSLRTWFFDGESAGLTFAGPAKDVAPPVQGD